MPILRIKYIGGPLHGAIGNVPIAVSPKLSNPPLYTSNPLIGYYLIDPERLPPTSGAHYQATWIPNEG
jgi:hypothetical protein